jgi:hypothetical protein
MAVTTADLKKELRDLYNLGVELLLHEVQPGKPAPAKKKSSAAKEKREDPAGAKEERPIILQMDYQKWYSRCLPVVRQLLPDRYAEFCEQYKQDKRKEITFSTYTVSDYMISLQITRGGEPTFNTKNAFAAKFQLQLTILNSAYTRLDSALNDIAGVLQAELFDSELEAAEDLFKKKHLRAAGALAGVTIEAHLGRVAANHQLTLPKKAPTIADLNELLKSKELIDIPVWRHIQRLADIRNIAVHAKDREPTSDEIQDLLSGAKKVVTSVF